MSSIASTWASGSSVSSAISSFVGSRPSFVFSARVARWILRSRWAMFVGTRIVRALFSIPRWIAWRIQYVAYVENLKPRRQSNFSAARIRPKMPSWMRSSSGSSFWGYFFAIETTSARLELIIRSFAAGSPCSMRLDSSTSSAAVSSGWRRISLRNSPSASVVAAARLPLP